jgi:hypothetical protein
MNAADMLLSVAPPLTSTGSILRARTQRCATGGLDTFQNDISKSSKDFQMTKPIDALKAIARYVETKKPKTLAEAQHMLYR